MCIRDRLERLQSGALRCIYGYEVPYSRMRVMAEVKTLRQRRIEACDKFAAKCLGSVRFLEWFPRKGDRTSGRSGEAFREDYARCNRLRDTPLYFMRRRLNGKPGKTYGERNKEYRDAGRMSTEMNPKRSLKRSGKRTLTDNLN